MFDRISSIQIDSTNQKTNLFVTFDVDWASDEVIEYTHNILLEYNIQSTWFITHQSNAISNIVKDKKIELGIHPNFNDLLEGTKQSKNSIKERINTLLEITGGAKIIRSHSMTQNSRMLDTFFELGLTHDCNHYIPYYADIDLISWKLWNGLIKVPYFWEDDLNMGESNSQLVDKLIQKNTLRVFDFHPIHVFLNTKLMDNYEESRSFHKCIDKLRDVRYDGYGTENFLRELIEKHIARGGFQR